LQQWIFPNKPMDKKFDKKFIELIGAAFEQPRDEEFHRELSARLEDDPEACAAFLAHFSLHGDLYYFLSGAKAEVRALDQVGIEAIRPLPKSSSPTTTLGSTTPETQLGVLAQSRFAPFSKKSRSWWGMGLLAVAASLLFSATWPWYPATQRYQVGLREPTIVATIMSTDQAIWQGDSFSIGESLRTGSELRLRQGVVKVNMSTGAELLLQGPCHMLLDSPNRVRLRDGKVTARVAEWATGFAVETSSFKLVDLGTRFAVETNATGITEAHVLEGSVRIEPIAQVDASRNSFLLGEGEAVRLDWAHHRADRLAANSDDFLIEAGDFRPYRSLQLRNTGHGLSMGDEDPHWRVIRAVPAEGLKGPQYAVVCEEDERYLSNNADSQWVSVAQHIRPGCLPNATYTFQTEFDLSGYDLSTVVILADILADNGVAALRINGEDVDLVPWHDNEYLQEFHRFRRAEILKGFVPGKNSIEIDIWNGVYRHNAEEQTLDPSPNPMAIRVEWQAFGIPAKNESAANETI
jgi:hypothetical protein